MMFEDIKKAENFGKTKNDYVIFKLVKHKGMKPFEWGVLPFGRYKNIWFWLKITINIGTSLIFF